MSTNNSVCDLQTTSTIENEPMSSSTNQTNSVGLSSNKAIHHGQTNLVPAQLITDLQVKMTKYATSLDPRGFIPVYEYAVNSQPIMWDRELGYVYWTGIWKALGREKSEITKIVDGDPTMTNVIVKIRGGYLKIQGTWIPYDNARLLATRTCWSIRQELSVIFGPNFPETALDPNHPEFLRAPASHEKRINGCQRAKKLSAPKRKRTPTSNALTLLRNAKITPCAQINFHKLSRDTVIPKPLDSKRELWKKPIKLAPLNNPHEPIIQIPDHYMKFNPVYSSSPTNSSVESICNEEFCSNSDELNQAIAASMSLLQLSNGLKSNPDFIPPPSFNIAGSMFEWTGQNYLPIN